MANTLIPELIIIIFLFLYLLRPVFKGLRFLDGIIWLPLLSFILLICLFFAYGFRPECILLLIFTIITVLFSIPLLFGSISVQKNDKKPRNSGTILTICGIIALIFTSIPMFVFSPKIPPVLSSENVEIRKICNESAKKDYYLRIYYKETNPSINSPLVFLLPPESGSVYAVDKICTELMEQGFDVITYSRRGFDSPAAAKSGKYLASPRQILKMWQAFSNGTKKRKANNWGQYLEAERQKDIEFLLPLICRNHDEKGTTPVFLAGYGAAGSAAVFLFEQPAFSMRHANVLGIAAVESRLWRSYLEDVSSRRLEPHWLPQPEIPVLYLVSDNAFAAVSSDKTGKSGKKSGQYRAVLDAFRNSRNPAILAAFEGTGPFAYSDVSLTHPLYASLFPGQIKRKNNAEMHADTAAFIGNFFIDLIDPADTAPELLLPEKKAVNSAVIAERRY